MPATALKGEQRAEGIAKLLKLIPSTKRSAIDEDTVVRLWGRLFTKPNLQWILVNLKLADSLAAAEKMGTKDKLATVLVEAKVTPADTKEGCGLLTPLSGTNKDTPKPPADMGDIMAELKKMQDTSQTISLSNTEQFSFLTSAAEDMKRRMEAVEKKVGLPSPAEPTSKRKNPEGQHPVQNSDSPSSSLSGKRSLDKRLVACEFVELWECREVEDEDHFVQLQGGVSLFTGKKKASREAPKDWTEFTILFLKLLDGYGTCTPGRDLTQWNLHLQNLLILHQSGGHSFEAILRYERMLRKKQSLVVFSAACDVDLAFKYLQTGRQSHQERREDDFLEAARGSRRARKRPKNDPPGSPNESCRLFAQDGTCRFGSRCKFRHVPGPPDDRPFRPRPMPPPPGRPPRDARGR